MNAQPLVELFFQDMTLPMLTEANQSQPHCDEPHNQKICSFLEWSTTNKEIMKIGTSSGQTRQGTNNIILTTSYILLFLLFSPL